MADTDFVGAFLGPFGRWQLRSTLLIFLVKIPSAWFMACLIFTTKSPLPGEVFCQPGQLLNDTELWIRSAHQGQYNRIENEDSFNFCHVYENAEERFSNVSSESQANLVPCLTFEHRPTYISILHQYQLFCDRTALVALTQSFHLLGVLIGGIIAYFMLKSVSPRKIMLVGMISQIFLGIATGLAPNYELHLFFRCSVAATCSLMCIGIMIVSDITAGKYRVISICLFEQFWSIGVILLPFMSTWWDSWSMIYVAISLPTLSLILMYYWIPDSPRWLLKHGRVEEAKEVLLRAAATNRKNDFTEDELDKHLTEISYSLKEQTEAKWTSIWTGEGVKRKLLGAHIAWSIYLMLYFGLLLHVRVMGRKYLEVNTAIAGISEIVGTFIGLMLIMKTSLKWLWTSLLNVLTSVIAFSAIFVPDTMSPFNRMVIYMATAMLLKMSVSTSLSIFITSTTEIVSKDKKKMANHSAVTCTRTLVIIAPFIGYLVIYGQLVPQMLMSVMNICAAFLVAICIDTPRTLPKKVCEPSNL